MKKEEILKKYFGYDHFRLGQGDIIDNIINKQNVVAIMPTGAGKSICYQVPAMMMEGISIVVSPLISLMKDQVMALVEVGIKAAYINSSLSASQVIQVNKRLKNNEYKIIYVAPERLMNEEFLEVINDLNISMLTIDEAHCISRWGQDFRPSYTKIIDFIKVLNKDVIISAFTATATSIVKEDIIKSLHLIDPYVLTTGFDRENIYFDVRQPIDKFKELVSIIKQNTGKCGIIYCISRKLVEELYLKINALHIPTSKYHAGMSSEERIKHQDDFIYDRTQVMVATNAFGMGIDKSNVSFVVHFNMPKDLESYYQEAGRAGRDGSEAQAILLYGKMDVRTNKFLIENSNNNEISASERAFNKTKDEERLKIMTFYATTNKCLRYFILDYFSQHASNYCGKCSNCLTNFEKMDYTIEAQKLVSTIYRLKEYQKSYGKVMVCDIVHGSNKGSILENNLDRISTYGLMRELEISTIRQILDYLIEEDYLRLSSGEFPIIELTPNSVLIIKNQVKIELQVVKEVKTIKHHKHSEINDGLFEALKITRRNLADQEKVPAFIIFSDKTLLEMCRYKPETKDEMLDISGVGSMKMLKYGNDFIKTIINYKKGKGE